MLKYSEVCKSLGFDDAVSDAVAQVISWECDTTAVRGMRLVSALKCCDLWDGDTEASIVQEACWKMIDWYFANGGKRAIDMNS